MDYNKQICENRACKPKFISYDILEGILVLLPVKSLLRFKSVSKQVYDLISTSTFVKSHHCNCITKSATTRIHLYDAESPWSVSINSKLSEIQQVEIHNPFTSSFHGIFGSCNGLLLVASNYQSFMWNPSTGEYHKLFPRHNIRQPDYKDGRWNQGNYYPDIKKLYGLGYSSEHDEYKGVLFIVEEEYCTDSKSLFLCSSRTGYWKEATHDFDFPYSLNSSSRGVTLNGCPHWLFENYVVSGSGRHMVLIYFDIMDEKFKALSTPEEWLSGIRSDFCLDLLDGCLCVTERNFVLNTTIVWVLNKYGAEGSWTNLFEIPHSVTTNGIRPMGFMNNGDDVVLDVFGGTIVTYNFKTKEKTIAISTPQDLLTCDHFFAEYVESLFSPRSFAQVLDQEEDEKSV